MNATHTHNKPQNAWYSARLFHGLFLLTAYGALTSCDGSIIRSNEACVRDPSGLSREPYLGQELERGQLSLIFTGGPSDFTSDISSLLYENNIQASFFVEGRYAEGQWQKLKKVFDQGHLIGNSGYSGQNLIQSKIASIEVRLTDHLIEPLIKGNMFLFYPPQGQIDEKLRQQLNEAGLGKYVGPILPLSGRGSSDFVSDTECWLQELGLDSCVQNYLVEIRGIERGIVAFSDQHPLTFDLISQLLPVLINEGFSFIRLDEIPSINFALVNRGGRPLKNDNSNTCQDYK